MALPISETPIGGKPRLFLLVTVRIPSEALSISHFGGPWADSWLALYITG